ncbi:MAG: hypothetical protein SPF69_04335 [Candidatus Ornithospirochaeta sp.]|nr:hypothetical protein [Sphaerochaetaceae bacterium]MDY5523298.1 hypothetical protein [Candidatus Ornithospirochaeta sp.]
MILLLASLREAVLLEHDKCRKSYGLEDIFLDMYSKFIRFNILIVFLFLYEMLILKYCPLWNSSRKSLALNKIKLFITEFISIVLPLFPENCQQSSRI